MERDGCFWKALSDSIETSRVMTTKICVMNLATGFRIKVINFDAAVFEVCQQARFLYMSSGKETKHLTTERGVCAPPERIPDSAFTLLTYDGCAKMFSPVVSIAFYIVFVD